MRLAFGKLEGTKNILGLDNYAVLCQEYLEGDEWVVDTVSRAGEHKVVALWKYDKRDYHGSPVVYHGMRLHNVESPYEKLKELTRGKRVDAEGMRTFVSSLSIPEDAKKRLMELTPASYIGHAAKLARQC